MKYGQRRRRLLFGQQGMARSITGYGDNLSPVQQIFGVEKEMQLGAGSVAYRCNGVDSDPSRETSTIGSFFPCELDFSETSEEEGDDFRVVEIRGIISRGVEGF